MFMRTAGMAVLMCLLWLPVLLPLSSLALSLSHPLFFPCPFSLSPSLFASFPFSLSLPPSLLFPSACTSLLPFLPLPLPPFFLRLSFPPLDLSLPPSSSPQVVPEESVLMLEVFDEHRIVSRPAYTYIYSTASFHLCTNKQLPKSLLFPVDN